MDRQEFITYIREPSRLGHDSLPGIEKLAEDFPYCQSLKILRLLNLHLTNHVMYGEQLKHTAASIADRKRLRQLIAALSQEKPQEPETKTPAPPLPEPPENIPEGSTILPPEEEEKAPVEKEKPAVLDEVPDEPHQAHTKIPAVEETEEERLLRLKQIVENRLNEIGGKDTTETPDITEEEKEEATDQEKLSKEELIDKFIEEQPSISRPKAEFFDPVKVARHSTTEKDDLVSETLANIHAQQGNTKKAIEIYRRLSLKFPEKSSYFAARIEKLKTEN